MNLKNLYCFYAPEEGAEGGSGAENTEGATNDPGYTPTDAGAGDGFASVDLFADDDNGSGKSGDASVSDVKLIDSLPDEYKEKTLFKDMKNIEDLAKWAVNAEGLIGKKTIGVPAEDAPAEEWDKFYASVRPKEATEYEFKDLEVQDDQKETYEALKGTRNENLMTAMKESFYKNGLSKRQAEAIMQDYESAQMTHVSELQELSKTQDKEFDTLADKMFGADRVTAVEKARKLLEEYTPSEAQAKIASLPNEALLVLATTLINQERKYTKEDSFVPNKSNTSTSSDANALRAEARKLMSLPEYSNEFHPQHSTVKRQVQDVYDRIKAVSK